MKKLLTLTLLSGIAMHAQAPTTLGALRNKQRVLLVFAGAHDPRVEQQWAILVDQRKQAAERDLTTVLLTRSPVKMHDGNGAPSANLEPAEEAKARIRFGIANDDFTVILIGKDGGEKLRAHTPMPWQTLAGTIDAMPMRQSEMRHTR